MIRLSDSRIFGQVHFLVERAAVRHQSSGVVFGAVPLDQSLAGQEPAIFPSAWSWASLDGKSESDLSVPSGVLRGLFLVSIDGE